VFNSSLKPQMIVATSPYHYHAYWLVDGLALDDFEAVQRDIARRFGGDPNVCDLPRVMRLPGFFHNKNSPPFRVNLIRMDSAEPFPAANFQRRPDFVESRQVASREFATPDVLEDLRSALAVFDADSRKVWVENAHRLKQLGDEGFRVWDEWAKRSVKYDALDAVRVWDSAHPVDTGYRSVFSHAQDLGWINPQAKGARLISARTPGEIIRFTRVGDLKPHPIDWAIEGWMPADSLAALVAPPGVGKTLLAIDWAACIASGTPWLGRAVREGPVFYLAGEGGNGLANRIAAWQIANEVLLDDVNMFVSDGLPPLCDLTNVRAVIEAIRRHIDERGPPVLIVVDTLARAFGAENENETAAMNAYIAGMDLVRREFGSANLTIHHVGHESLRRTGRGSSALPGAVDFSAYMQRTDIGVALSSEKEKDWAKPATENLIVKQVELPIKGPDGKPVTSAVIAPYLEGITGFRKDARDRNKAEALRRYAAGESSKALCEEFGFNLKTFQYWMKKDGISRSPGRAASGSNVGT
jgi:hypothetical protein